MINSIARVAAGTTLGAGVAAARSPITLPAAGAALDSASLHTRNSAVVA